MEFNLKIGGLSNYQITIQNDVFRAIFDVFNQSLLFLECYWRR